MFAQERIPHVTCCRCGTGMLVPADVGLGHTGLHTGRLPVAGCLRSLLDLRELVAGVADIHA